MKPKKKSSIGPILYAICFFLILYFALHGAAVYETVADMYASGEIARNQQIITFLNLFSIRVEDVSLTFTFNQYTKQWLLYGLCAWMVIVILIESSKKNFIHGQEYGTDRFGTKADIQDLLASSIEKEEIKKAKRVRTPIGRLSVRLSRYKQCEREGQAIQKVKLENLKEEEEARKRRGEADRKLYKEQQAKVKQEVKETVALSKRQAWEPDQFKLDYESRLEEIEKSVVLSPEDKEKHREITKKAYENKLRDFYSGKDRIAKIRAKYKDADMLLTKTESISFYNWKVNQNILIMGGSGSGKSTCFALPNLLQAHSSFICTDPKGELLEKVGYFLSEIKGYKIKVLNLNSKKDSDGFNPFVYIHPDRDGYEERVLTLIETLIVNTEGENQKSNDPFWPMAERLFLQSIFFFTVDGFVPEERNFNTVLKLIAMLEIGEEEDNKDSDLDVFVSIFAERFGDDHIGVEQYREFRSKASGKTAKSIVISAVARLSAFRAKEVRRIFSYDSLELDRVGEEKMAIFVVVPPTDDTFNFVAGMFFTTLFQELEYCATQVHKHEGQRLPVPCRFILDEFATTCVIPKFTRIIAYARSFGIGIVPIIQSLEQLKAKYEKEWGVIMDNCNTTLFLGKIQHNETLKYMSELTGKGTFDKRTTGLTRGSHGSSSKNEDVVGRELMMPGEIRTMKDQECLLVVGGRPVFRSEKNHFSNHPNYQFTSDANKKYAFDIAEYRKKLAQKEASHREEEPRAELQPSENAVVEVTPIMSDGDPINAISWATQNADRLEPIPDEDMQVPDGEDAEREVNSVLLQDLLEEEKAEKQKAKAARVTVSEETKIFLEKERSRKIQIEENVLRTVNRLGRIYRTLAVIPDEETKVDDGESTKTMDEEALAFIMDNDDGVSAEEINDVFEDLDEFLNELADHMELDGTANVTNGEIP